MEQRVILDFIRNDVKQKMVLLSGPRQCGKTTLSRNLAPAHDLTYLNWDVAAHRKLLQGSELPEGTSTWVFDEIHKNRSWRNWLKGIFDLHGKNHQILVTGSARLDLYSRGGDSLQGRYFKHRLHPFTLNEVGYAKPFHEFEFAQMQLLGSSELLEGLLEFSGFPEPFTKGENRFAKRWRLQYGDLLINEDLKSLESVRDIAKVELLYDKLRSCVGSVLSINSLREDLEVSFDSVKHWLEIFEKLYATFRISPYGPPKIKAVKKEQKLYFWDWARADSMAAKMENLVAVHLLRMCHWMEDVEGVPTELRYFRTPSGHEVDFVVLKNKKPWLAVEVKASDDSLDPNFKYFLERTEVPHAFQVHFKGTKDFVMPNVGKYGVRCLPASRFLANLA